MSGIATRSKIYDFLTFLRDCEQRFHIAEADEQEANAITNDIHHDMELLPHNEDELLQLAQIDRGPPPTAQDKGLHVGNRAGPGVARRKPAGC